MTDAHWFRGLGEFYSLVNFLKVKIKNNITYLYIFKETDIQGCYSSDLH